LLFVTASVGRAGRGRCGGGVGWFVSFSHPVMLAYIITATINVAGFKVFIFVNFIVKKLFSQWS
jgi:hypothetical protein